MTKKIMPTTIVSILVGIMASPTLVLADGLSDLENALNTFTSRSPINAELTFTTSNLIQNGEETRQRDGNVTMTFLSNEQGLQMQYEDEVIAQLQTETQRRAEDEDAKTPTLMALNNIDAVDITRILNSTLGLKRLLKQATFISEEPVEKDGKTLRQLNFTLPLDTLITDKQTRKYVKKFSSSYQIIIDDTGMPLESHLEFEGKGRAYIVIRVEASGESHSTYQVHRDRLVRTQLEEINRWDSTFGSGENVDNEVLTILD